jgi:hypothetical protein
VKSQARQRDGDIPTGQLWLRFDSDAVVDGFALLNDNRGSVQCQRRKSSKDAASCVEIPTTEDSQAQPICHACKSRIPSLFFARLDLAHFAFFLMTWMPPPRGAHENHPPRFEGTLRLRDQKLAELKALVEGATRSAGR